MSNPRLRVSESPTFGGKTMSLNTGPETHPDLPGRRLTGGAYVSMSGGGLTAYNNEYSFLKDEDFTEPSGQMSLYHISRPSIDSLYASEKGRPYVPQLLALARKHAIKATGVLPTHSTKLSPDSQRVVKRAVDKGWVVKNPKWGGYIEPPRNKRESTAKGLDLAGKHIDAHFGAPTLDSSWSRDMEVPSDQVGGIIDEGKSEVESLMRSSMKESTRYPIFSRGPNPEQGRLF